MECFLDDALAVAQEPKPQPKPIPTLTGEEVWLRAWCSSILRTDANGPGDAAWYADKCLDSFNSRFRNTKQD